jgi:hypothetical protein
MMLGRSWGLYLYFNKAFTELVKVCFKLGVGPSSVPAKVLLLDPQEGSHTSYGFSSLGRALQE